MKDLRCSICGMIINEKNYNINSAAIINKNNKNSFRTCPFCGVGSDYLKLEGDQSFKYLGEIDSITLRVLDHAMKLEVFNSEFYKEASILAVEQSTKELFMALSKIEFMHARIHQTLGGFDKLPVLQKIDYSRFSSDNELLEAAKKREEHAVSYYSKYINEVCDDKIKFIFLSLSEVEKEHIELASICNN
jgi:rubrerythrin